MVGRDRNVGKKDFKSSIVPIVNAITSYDCLKTKSLSFQ